MCALVATASFAQTDSPPASDPVTQRIEALKARRTQLQSELRATLTDDSRLVNAPQGGILIGVPTSLVRRIVTETVMGPLSRIKLKFGDIAVQKADTITTKKLGLTMTLGTYDMGVRVRDVTATLKPKTPQLVFGGNRIGVTIPMSVEGGRVRANLNFKWDGKQLAGAICGDLAGEHDLKASVPTIKFVVKGRFDIAADGDRLVAKPVFAPISLDLHVEPEQKTWDFVEGLIKSRNSICETAIRKARLAERVRDAVGQSYKADIPRGWVKPVSMPAAFEQNVDVAGRSAGLRVEPTGVSITKTRLWYGGDLKVIAAVPAPAKR